MSKKTPAGPLTPEWSLKVEVAALRANAPPVTLTATEQQRRDLARRLKVNAIEKLEGEAVLLRQPGGHIIHVTGQVRATVLQSCIVTLEPVHNEISEDIDAWYSDEEQVVSFSRVQREKKGLRADVELEILPEKEDPEPVVDGVIDIGELAAQYLSLAVDPYPRSAAAKAAEEPVVKQAGTRPNPFAALKDWKANKDKKS